MNLLKGCLNVFGTWLWAIMDIKQTLLGCLVVPLGLSLLALDSPFWRINFIQIRYQMLIAYASNQFSFFLQLDLKYLSFHDAICGPLLNTLFISSFSLDGYSSCHSLPEEDSGTWLLWLGQSIRWMWLAQSQLRVCCVGGAAAVLVAVRYGFVNPVEVGIEFPTEAWLESG